MWLSDGQSKSCTKDTISPSLLFLIIFLSLKEIGVGLTAFGLFFMLMGVMMLFDAGLLAIGNVRPSLVSLHPFSSLSFFPFLVVQILFLSGIAAIIGPKSTLVFFSRREKLRGTICFLGGILLVLSKFPILGFLVEVFGFLNLFG